MNTEQTKVTKEQIDAWKKKYDSVFKITVEGKECFLRNPNRKEMEYASLVGKKSAIKFNEYLLKTCWLAGDMEIQTNDNLFMSVSSELAAIIDLKESKLEKL